MSSRITYRIMQPWPFDIRKVSGEVAIRIAAHQAVVDGVDDFGARIGGADVQRLHLLGNVEDAFAILQTTPPRGRCVEGVSTGHVVHATPPLNQHLQNLSGATPRPRQARKSVQYQWLGSAADFAGRRRSPYLGGYSMMVQ